AAAGARGTKLGAKLREASEGIQVLLNLKPGEGLVVAELTPGGALAEAGLQAMDILLSFDGSTVGTLEGLKEFLAGCRPGQEVRVVYFRQGKKGEATVTLGGDGAGAEAAPARPAPSAPPAREDRRTAPERVVDSALDAAGRLKAKLRKLGGDALARIEEEAGKLRDMAEEERREGFRIIERKLAETLGLKDEDELRLMRRALRLGVRKYVGDLVESVKEGARDGAAQLERLLEERLRGMTGGGEPAPGAKKDVDRILDEILGEKSKKPAPPRADSPPGQPEGPPEGPTGPMGMDPEQLRQRFKEMRERIQREGFPTEKDEIRKTVDTMLGSMGMDRKGVRGLLESMGLDRDTAKGMAKQQMAMSGLELTDEQVEAVLDVIFEDAEPAKPKVPGWLGVSLGEGEDGPFVQAVVEGSPAEAAGFREGDRIAKVSGRATGSVDAVREILKKRGAGDTLDIEVVREGKAQTLRPTLGKREQK
ncbi:MAG: PDZ domain-containing protein, partial [Planctomycetales bacterium]|nr:PDZ domain-containing protein [Planctomycetales bacterium]